MQSARFDLDRYCRYTTVIRQLPIECPPSRGRFSVPDATQIAAIGAVNGSGFRGPLINDFTCLFELDLYLVLRELFVFGPHNPDSHASPTEHATRVA